MALWQNSLVMQTGRPWDTRTKIAFCPQGHLPSRTEKVWASCVALHPHSGHPVSHLPPSDQEGLMQVSF